MRQREIKVKQSRNYLKRVEGIYITRHKRFADYYNFISDFGFKCVANKGEKRKLTHLHNFYIIKFL